MSESEVTQIRDEDVLRRMWQQTEDFGRKKEIRAHMYKLREERLRDLYSPEPHPQGKGCEFSTAHAQRHGQSFADQTFQSMKSKEVRDASSPTKEFTCRGQDLKELSNAGWNVESEDRTTDDGRTQVKFVNANIEGRYDVEGGQGQFAAVDKQRRAVTEHQDATSSLRRDESSTDSAAREHVVRQTEDGTHVSSTTSSSNTSSKFEQVSSTTHQVPLEDYDQRTHDTNRNERLIKITNDDYAQSLRKNDSSTLKHNSAELVSRKVEYPDDNTRVIVETRVTPDGTRVTSTRREFRVPAQSTRSEYHSNQSESYSSQHTSDHRDSTNTRHTIENRADDIVDSQRNVDDYDFKRQLREYTNNDDDDYSTQHHVTRTNKKVTDHSQTNNEYSQKRYETRVNSKVIDQHQSTVNKNAQTRQQRIVDIDQSTINRADHTQTQHRIVDRRTDYQTDDTDRQTTIRDQDIPHKIVKETRHFDDSEEKVHNISRVRKDHEEVERVSRNRTVIDEGDREIPKDRTTPVDRPYGVPKDKIPTIEKTRDIPRDKTMPVDESHDVPRNDIVPERFREAPSDGTVPDDRPREIPVNRTVTNGKVHHIKKDTQVEEVIEKKTSSDHYQTTYHNDFQSRKVSTDWSPTHQAWASTLRSDTPSTTRPSTRASSPGSKTFKSSTSSLRSSVSPDKLYRKPTSRGGSPTKVDSHSPTRTVTSDRYSSTHSTHSVTQETINKNTSPERKPPTGRSPARSGYSPDRKPQDNYRQRPSASPEKRPKKSSDRPSLSPEQKPTDGYPRTTSPLGKKEGPKPPVGSRQSPERRPTYQRTDENPSDAFPGISPYRKTLSPDRKLFDSPDRSSPRTSPSPDRRPGYQKPADIPGNDTVSSPSQPRYSTDDSQPKPGSPGRNTNLQQPTRQADKKFFDRSDRSSPRSSPSPDRRPGYQKPADTPNHPTITSPSKSRYPIDDSPRKPGSPDRKPNFQHSTSQPDRKPFDRPDRSSPRSSPSPDRRPGYQKHADTPGHPTVLSSKPKQQPNRPGEQHPQDSPTKRPSMSPERKPGYISPTGFSEPDEKTRRLRPENEPDCKSPRKEVPTPISDKEDFTDKTTKIKEDHYRFVDEETKVYTHTDRIITDKKSVKTSSDDDYRPRNKSPSPVHHVTGKDLPDYCNILNPRELPFDMDKPTKDSVFITENDELYGRNDETVETVDIITSTKYDKQTDENTTKKIAQKKDRPEEKDSPSRETSPSKYGTYDKKKPREKIDTTVVTTITSENAKDVKFDSLTNRDKTSPKKMPGVPTSPVKKSPRDSSSPSKFPTKDTKYKHTTDFITTEITTEEINKKTTTKDRPRQLVTPSSSPTRKPKNTETEPSTGQSSPTTSVSGFVYFGSPCTEKPLVTDLDEPYPETLEDISKRPENLDVKKSPSPSKIPCRSPSPEKQVPTTKENLPRKSSLKKPSTEFNLVSPVEKPPTNFRVSPTDDKPDLLDHKVVKKDRPSKPETGEPTFSDKPKPPLHRRETYDDRCKKILGLVDNTTTETETGETRKYTRKPDSSQNSPSVSPCDSPTPNDSSPIAEYPATKKTTKVDVTDFIMHEKEDLIKTTTTHNQQKTQIPSRDNSPTKLQDIITKPNLVTDKITNDKTETDIVSKTITPKYPSPRQSSEKDVTPESTQKHPDRSSDRKRISSPSKLSKPTESLPAKTNLSPERKPENKYPKDKSPTRPTFDKTVTSTVTSIFDVSTNLDDSKESINITKKTKPTRVLESPTRDSTRSSKTLPEQTGQPRTTSPSKQQPKDGLPVRKSQSPERKITSDTSKPKRVAPYDSQPKESPEKIPGYMKTTTAIKSKYENYHATEDIDETYVTKIQEKKEPRTSSPTYQKLREKSPIKPVHPSDSSTKRPDSSPTRKPTQAAPKTQPDAKQEVPGYMRSTKTTNTKFDKTLISEDVQETNKSSKTIIEKERIPSGSISPTRKHSQPKSPSERTPSPTKPSRPSEMSIDKKPSKFQPTSPIKESSTKKPESKHPAESSLTRPGSEKVTDYMKTTASMTLKHEHDTSYDVKTTEEDTKTSTVTEKRYSRDSESPSRPTPKSIDRSSPKYLRTSSPSRPSNNDEPKMHVSPEDKPGYSTKESPKTKPVHPKDTSPTRSKTPSYMTSTDMTATFKTICTTEDVEDFVSIKEKYPSETPSHESPASNRPRTLSPLKPMDNLPRTVAKSPDRKSPVKDNSFPEDKHYIHTPVRTSASPERPSYMKPTASITSKFDTTTTTYKTEDSYVTNVDERRNPSTRKSPTYSPRSPQDEPRAPGHSTKPEEPRQLRTPSPTKKTTTAIETNTDFIMSEREQEILNKVQKSLRKLSPERKEKSPSRERSPSKTTTSLQDLDIIVSETIETDRSTSENLTEIAEEQLTITSKVPRPAQLKDDKSKEQKTSNKPSSSNASPIKRTPTAPTSNKVDKNQESPTKPRSFSPKKPMSQADRPHSPQHPKVSGIKPRDQIPPHLTRKPTPATLSTTKIEKLTTDIKKTKQNVVTKTSLTRTTNKSILTHTSKINESDIKRTSTPKKDNASPKKDVVTRTASDTAIKSKKTSSPQRMKSKPEIQVSDMSTKSQKSQKPTIKEPHSKLPTKPKSATSLNTSIDEDDIIIDVQQSKSSRENSPDRICPTPINFVDDVGIPRFPDEVSEPDDDVVKRNHHTIHETESVVDDIVEICEDEELFVKKSDMEVMTEQDDSLLSVNDKVSKFTDKIRAVHKPKDTTIIFKDTERNVHSDFVDENLRSDECLLTVSEKVNKFAKVPRDAKDNRSPSRKITDEYDRDTVYTDDYTKLSVNDKAHLFVETAKNIKSNKVKPAQKVERPDLSQVDESLKSDDCLLSVSDKVNKFVKTAEQYDTETQEVEERETKIKQQHEKVIRQVIDHDNEEEETYRTQEKNYTQEKNTISDKSGDRPEDKTINRAYEPKQSQPKVKNYSSPNSKPVDRVPAVKITTLRSSEAVKKAKALFENIASTQKTDQKEITHTTKTTKLTDIGVIKKSPKSDSTTVLHPSVENISPQVTDIDSEIDFIPHTEHSPSDTLTKRQRSHVGEKSHSSPHRLTAQLSEVPRSKSPMRQNVEIPTTKTVLSRYPAATRSESPRHRPESPKLRTESPSQRTESPRLRPDSEKPEKVPGYLRPTKTSQIKEETKVEEAEVSSRRGSGKFGIELRRTSAERSTVSSERRRSIEHHQPCIEDIFDVDLLEQMLEKVVGYEQRRRIRAQIRVAKHQNENVVETNTYTTTIKKTRAPKSRSPERKVTKSPERVPKTTPQRTLSPERSNKSTPHKTVLEHTQSKEPVVNGHTTEPTRTATAPRQRPQSPEKPAPKSTLVPKTSVRQPSPDKRRTTSPSKVAPKPKGNRFNEYASAYMKKVGLNESEKNKFTDTKTKKTTDRKQTIKHERQQKSIQEFTTTKNITERTSSKDVIEIVQTNGKRSLSPEQRQSPERKVQFPSHKTHIPDRKVQSPDRKANSPERKPQSPERKGQSPDRKAYSPERKHSPERLHQRTPSPDFKRSKSDAVKATIIKTVYDIEKKIPSKPAQEEKPSWVTNRNLKKITTESRTFSSKKIENEKPKYRAPSPSKVIAKPIDVITSSYGPGPLDADGKPLFGIKALRNGGSNFQVKGTVIRSEFHSRNGGAPEGTVSVTAYSSQPEDLEQLLTSQGAEPPSRIHGLAAITTTKTFGGDTGNTLANVHTKEDRASLEQFTHHDRRVEHLERSYDTTTQEFGTDTGFEEISEHTRIEDITGNRRIDSKNDRQDRTDRSREPQVTEVKRQENRRDRTERKKEEVTEVKRQKVEESREKMERREDKKTVRQSSVKSLTEKYIKSANESGKPDRSAYPKAGLILRTTTMRDSVSGDDAPPGGLTRADSEHSICSVDDTVVTTTTERTGDGIRTTTTKTTHHHHHPAVVHMQGTTITHHEPAITTKKTVISQEPVITTRKTMVVTQEPVVTSKRMTVVSQEPVTHRVTQGRQAATVTTERSFLDSNTKVTGVQDILTRMKNADIVIQEGDSTEDSEARALLNKFLGATVLMAGMQGYVPDQADGKLTMQQETVRSGGGGKVSSLTVQELDLDQCWDERLLKKLLEECTDYEQRRRLRARIRTLMAEQEACASAVTEALGACDAEAQAEGGAGDAREEEEVTVTTSVRRDSSDKTVSSSTTTKTSKVIEMTRPAPKPVSPFAKFRQLEKQNSTNSPKM